MTEPVKLSPINAAAEKLAAQFSDVNGWRVPARFADTESELAAAGQAVALADRSNMGKVRLEGASAAAVLETAPLAVHEGRQLPLGHTYCLRPDLFFINCAPGGEISAVEQLIARARRAGGLVTVTDVTHGSAQLQIVGPRSAVLLSQLCGLDFGDEAFPNHAARQSSVAKTGQIILRHDVGRLPSYFLIGARSFGEYLWRTIIQAGESLGLQPVGIDTVHHLETGL